MQDTCRACENISNQFLDLKNLQKHKKCFSALQRQLDINIVLKLLDKIHNKYITPSNLHQIQKGRSILKSARSEDFKTVLDF